MEQGLRDLIAKNPNEEFRGLFVESGLSATRKNILVPGAVGVYSGGSNYNPAQVLRDDSVSTQTRKIDKLLEGIKGKSYLEMPIDVLTQLISLTRPDAAESESVWNATAIVSSINQFAKVQKQTTGYVYVDRDRGLQERRRETQGILEGGEIRNVPSDKIGLFMLRVRAHRGGQAAWWPQVRFPDGRYAFAFSL